MWTNVLISENSEDIHLLKQELKKKNVMVRVREKAKEDGVCYTLLVPRSELDIALNLIIDFNL